MIFLPLNIQGSQKTLAPGCWNLAEFRETGVNGPQVLSFLNVSEMRVRLRSAG